MLNYSAPDQQFNSLPSLSTKLDLSAAMQPGATALIDIRRYALLYITKLVGQLPDQKSKYRIALNVVLSPKATNEATPSPAGPRVTNKDRFMIAIVFNPDIIHTEKAKDLLQSTEVLHRIYAN